MANRREHWEKVYQEKSHSDMSWYQDKPIDSLKAIQNSGIQKDAPIIDIGGGDTFLVDELIADGYSNITLMDISQAALDRVKDRLGKDSDKVVFIQSDVLDLPLDTKYSFWHDRAVLHFLKDAEDQKKYAEIVNQGTSDDAFVYIATFSKDGPQKCSGLEVQQYDPEDLEELMGENFQKQNCRKEVHTTPFDTQQEFSICTFKKA